VCVWCVCVVWCGVCVCVVWCGVVCVCVQLPGKQVADQKITQ